MGEYRADANISLVGVENGRNTDNTEPERKRGDSQGDSQLHQSAVENIQLLRPILFRNSSRGLHSLPVPLKFDPSSLYLFPLICSHSIPFSFVCFSILLPYHYLSCLTLQAGCTSSKVLFSSNGGFIFCPTRYQCLSQ